MSITKFDDQFSEEVWESTFKDHLDSDVNDTMMRASKAIASVETSIEKQIEWTAKFYDMLSEFKGVAGGRIYANAGTDYSGTTLANCYVGPRGKYDIDSIDGILSALTNQVKTLKSEGGWGENFSYIRPRGTFINGIGVDSPGAVKFMELFDKSSEIITAGSGKKSTNAKAKKKIRKGAMMGVMDIWHPDIIEFITAKQQSNRLSKFNISVNVSDEFMDRVNQIKYFRDNKHKLTDTGRNIAALDKWDLIYPDTTFEKYKSEWDGDIVEWKSKGYPVVVYNTVSVEWLWNLIMESTYTRAEPGVLFLDRANHFNPLSYGEKIGATNPSMPAGTLVHTKTGIFPIDLLEGKEFEVKSLDGVWAPAKCFLSGENQPLLKFGIGNLKYIRSTKEHRWPVYDQRMKRIYKVYAKDLKEGDLIPLNRNERIGIYGDMTLTRDEGLFLGYLIGDGWFNYRKDTDIICGGITFGKHEKVMADKLLNIYNTIFDGNASLSEKESEYYFQFGNKKFTDILLSRYKVTPGIKNIPPVVWESNDDFIEGFIDGLLSSDGHVYSSGSKLNSIQLTTSRESLAFEFSKLLSFAGVNSAIYTTTSSDVSFPNGKDYNKEYHRWDVKISGGNLVNFFNVFDISHPDKASKLEEAANFVMNNVRGIRNNKFVEIKTVEDGGSENVWDISVYHDQHVFPSEWCYTGNCGEQTLSPGNICCLGTINLTQFINKSYTGFNLEDVAKYVSYMVRFLDNVNTYSAAPLPEYKDSMEKKRRIGCGVMGWGSSLMMMRIRFASEEADKIRTELMQAVATAAYKASIDLAVEKGMFEYCIPDKHIEAVFITNLNLPEEYMNKLRTTGIRNAALLSQQPNGNTSIFANIVSGGIEPIFMPEYIRTVIVNVMPDEISHVCPKWYEGEWFETDVFKFSQEGDEQILRGTFNGVVYKIDKNRGLTREVLCTDYGVRNLKERGLWNKDADWAVTTTELSAQDHVNDLKGFAKMTDSACSKTCNLPYEYSFDDFKGLYLDVYNTGYIKGFTTYRSGTMTSVLSAVGSNEDTDVEEIILDDVKLASSLPATVKTLKAEGKKYYLTVINDESNTRPIAFFVHTNHHEKTTTTSDAVDRLIELATTKGIPQKHINELIGKFANDTNVTKIARTISLLLRHGVLVKNVVTCIDKVPDVFVGSFLFAIKKYLASFIKDGENVEGACENCGGKMVFSEGCSKCVSCGSSKCG